MMVKKQVEKSRPTYMSTLVADSDDERVMSQTLSHTVTVTSASRSAQPC